MAVLRDGVDVTRAADILWTVLAADTYHSLVGVRRWSTDEFADWARAVVLHTVVAGATS